MLDGISCSPLLSNSANLRELLLPHQRIQHMTAVACLLVGQAVTSQASPDSRSRDHNKGRCRRQRLFRFALSLGGDSGFAVGLFDSHIYAIKFIRSQRPSGWPSGAKNARERQRHSGAKCGRSCKMPACDPTSPTSRRLSSLQKPTRTGSARACSVFKSQMGAVRRGNLFRFKMQDVNARRKHMNG